MGFNKTLTVKDQPSQGGDTINLGLTASSAFQHDKMTFVPKNCIVLDVNSDNKFTLFDAVANNCDNDIIDLKVANKENMWRISHVLFLMGNQRKNAFELSCEILVCDNTRSTNCDAHRDCLIN